MCSPKTIDLTPFFDASWALQLENSFWLKLKEKVRGYYSIKELSELTGKSEDSICKFHQGRYNANIGYLLKLCSLFSISKEELFDNVVCVYTRSKSSYFVMKKLVIDALFVEWYGAWIGDGDHSYKREALSMSNYSIDLLKLHIVMMRRLGFESNRLLVEVVSPSDEPSKIIKERWAKILGLSFNQVSTVTRMSNATQEGARVGLGCAGLFRVLHRIDSKIKKKILSSGDTIRIAYIKGIFAAEGSVRKKGKQVRLNMKDELELIFARTVLHSLGIFVKLPKWNPHSGCFELSIFGYENIRRFWEIGGFGLERKRSKLLDKCVNSYGKFPFGVRVRQIRESFPNGKNFTNKDLVNLLNLGPANARKITRAALARGLLKVDKTNKVYKYSLDFR